MPQTLPIYTPIVWVCIMQYHISRYFGLFHLQACSIGLYYTILHLSLFWAFRRRTFFIHKS